MHKQRAQVLVEFAIVTLVLIPLVLGILGAGRAFYWYVDMSGLARYGALYATSLSSATACSAAQTQVQSQVRNNFIANHPGQSAPTVTLTCPFPTVSPLTRTVTLTSSFDTLVPYSALFPFLGVKTLSTSATMPLMNS
jgi:Flp pilus assembly protein TadG